MAWYQQRTHTHKDTHTKRMKKCSEQLLARAGDKVCTLNQIYLSKKRNWTTSCFSFSLPHTKKKMHKFNVECVDVFNWFGTSCRKTRANEMYTIMWKRVSVKMCMETKTEAWIVYMNNGLYHHKKRRNIDELERQMHMFNNNNDSNQ